MVKSGIALAAAFGVVCSAQAVTTFDAADDFSSVTNPNGVWSYGYASSSTGSMILMLESQQRFVPSSLFGWSRGAEAATSSLPSAFHNPSAVPVPVIDYPAPVDPGALVVHPGDLADEDFVFVRFTAPADADYDIAASFEALDTTAGAQTLVIINSAFTLFNDTIVGFGDTAGYTSASSIGLLAGETIDFIVGNGGSFVNDSVQLEALVTQIPGPGALGTLTLLALAPRRRTFRR